MLGRYLPITLWGQARGNPSRCHLAPPAMTMTRQEKADALDDLFQGWQRLFSDIKERHPNWSDNQINKVAVEVTCKKLHN
jgi:hypothetical protein